MIHIIRLSQESLTNRGENDYAREPGLHTKNHYQCNILNRFLRKMVLLLRSRVYIKQKINKTENNTRGNTKISSSYLTAEKVL